MSLLDKVKMLSKEKGMSIYELEEKLEFGRNTIYQWNKRTPGIDKVQKVADFFNVSIDDLVGRSAPATDNRSQLLAAHIDDDVTDDEMADIIKYINFIKSTHNK